MKNLVSFLERIFKDKNFERKEKKLLFELLEVV